MNLKLLVSLLALLAFMGISAEAQDFPKLDAFLGYSYVRANPATSGVDSFNLNGGSANVAYNVNHWLSGVGDFGGYTNGNILSTGIDGTVSTYLFGPRISYRHFGRITPFGQVLFGVAHASSTLFGSTASQNAFAMTVGGGVDYRLSHHLAIRPVEMDYLLTRFNEVTEGSAGRGNQNNLRVSTGIVFRF